LFEEFDKRSESKRDGTVVRIIARYETGPKLYSWAALRVNGYWHLTGAKSPRYGLTYHELTEFFVADKEVVVIDVLQSAKSIRPND